MSPKVFECEVRRATTMKDQASDSPYWSGYRRGFDACSTRTPFFDKTNTDHVAWLEFRNSDDPLIASLGHGYTEGVQTRRNWTTPTRCRRMRGPLKKIPQSGCERFEMVQNIPTERCGTSRWLG
jgi:hypothetical protein